MAQLMPTQNDDAARQQLTSNFFYFVGDLLQGTDTTLRVDPNQIRSDGMLGPVGNAQSLGIGNGGEIYVRGSTGQYGTQQTALPAPALPTLAGLQITPGLMILAALAWFMLRK